MANPTPTTPDDPRQRLSRFLSFGQTEAVLQTVGPLQQGQKLRRPHKDLSKVCAVCGDQAMGYNFDAVTCESCKAFFRRNALKDEDYHRCSFANSCEINAVSRRFCQKCRLLKCFRVGMKKEWIENDEKLLQRKRKRIEKNKRKSWCPELDKMPAFQPLDGAMLRRKASSTGAVPENKSSSRSSSDSGVGGHFSRSGSPSLKRSCSSMASEPAKNMRANFDLETSHSSNNLIMRETVIQRISTTSGPQTAPILHRNSPFLWSACNGKESSDDQFESIAIPKHVLSELINAFQCYCAQANISAPPVVSYARGFLYCPPDTMEEGK